MLCETRGEKYHPRNGKCLLTIIQAFGSQTDIEELLDWPIINSVL